MRARAIVCALMYGLLPSRLYEPVPHYDCSYLEHLWLNVRYALRWLFRLEDESDRRFELEVNSRPVPFERCQRLP